MTRKKPQLAQPRSSRKSYQMLWVALLFLVIVGVVAGIIGIRRVNNTTTLQANKVADTDAAAAARYMDGSTGNKTPINDLAWRVVERQGSTTVEALEAQGTNFDGTLTLRITVGRAKQCYGYHFQQGQPVDYARLNYCTNDAALQLKTPSRNP